MEAEDLSLSVPRSRFDLRGANGEDSGEPQSEDRSGGWWSRMVSEEGKGVARGWVRYTLDPTAF